MSGQSPSEGSGRPAHPVGTTWDLALARQLVDCAARNAPPGLAQRLQEEWLADLTARQGAFARIRFGLGCCWATRVIAREFGAAAAGGSASGQQLLVAYGGYDFSRFSRRTVAMIGIVLLHVAVFYAYMSGLTQRIISAPAERIHVIMTPRTPERPLPLPAPRLAPPSVERLPTPLVPLMLPALPTAITVADSPRPNIVSVQPPTPRPVKRVIGGPGAGFPNTGDYYPPAARRLDETGNTIVNVCVDPEGRLNAAPTIVASSGNRQIDQGALRLARAGSGHYRPTTENGQPVSSCYAFRITFRLEDQ